MVLRTVEFRTVEFQTVEFRIAERGNAAVPVARNAVAPAMPALAPG